MDVVIPETINGVIVTELGERSFAGNTINSVVFPNTLISTGWRHSGDSRLLRFLSPTRYRELKGVPLNMRNLHQLLYPTA